MKSLDIYPWCRGKILSREQATARAEELRAAGKTLVTVNGAFDLLHTGHLVVLTEAKTQGDVLFVGMNTDISVKQYKGPDRPIVLETERAAMLAALSYVDYIVPIDAPEAAAEILRTVRPHMHVNGSEYGEPETWVEWPVMQEVGAKGHRVERRPGLATTDIIRKIKGE